MTSLKYVLVNSTSTKKTITINNVRSDIDSQTAKISAFGVQLTTNLDGDYSVDEVYKIVTEETLISLD